MGIHTRISRVLKSAGVVVGVVLAGSAVTAAPALAGANCAAGYHCLFYQDVNSSKHSYFDSGFLFCVNPGATVHSLPSNLRDRASSLRLRPRTSVSCLSN